MKILFFATYPDTNTGYSRIANILSNYFANCGHEIFYVGISNFNQKTCPRYIHPNITLFDAYLEEKIKGNNELYGVNVICDHITNIKPDIVFLYNDIIVISRIFNNFIKYNIQKNFKLYVYLDLVYKFEKLNLINHVNNFADMIFVFSDYWKNNLVEMGVNPDKIDIFSHGIDNKIFYPIDKQISRQQFNFNKDDFIILNTNRNSYRKCIDKTIDAFIQFLKIKNMNKNIKLFLNMNLTEGPDQIGYDILNLIKISCIRNKINYDTVILNHIYKHNDILMSDSMLNHLYNACDIGINTCSGEGFGLCNLEHGCLGRPQIISNVGGLSDIFSNDYSILVDPVTEIYISNILDYHGGYQEICSTDDFTDSMIKYYDNREVLETHGKLCREILNKKYNWDNILKSFVNKYL
jgi:glycosyltransferase involved in cell wall biosynthesis